MLIKKRILSKDVGIFLSKLVLIAIVSLYLLGGQPILAATQNWTFDTPANYTYDSAKIEVTGGQVQLKITFPGNWWDTNYIYRKEITLTNAGASVLTNFPAYLSVTKESGMQSDYDDLRFIDGPCASGGATVLDYEIDESDGSSADIFVRIPSFSIGTDTVCMYYGNGSATSGENITGVWDVNYLGVYHFSETPNDTADGYIDSTSNAHHGTGVSMSGNSLPTGIIGSGQDFVPTSDYIDLGPVSRWPLGSNFTLEAWVNHDAAGVGSDQCIVCQGSGNEILFWMDTGGSGDGFQLYLSGNYAPSNGSDTR